MGKEVIEMRTVHGEIEWDNMDRRGCFSGSPMPGPGGNGHPSSRNFHRHVCYCHRPSFLPCILMKLGIPLR